MTENDCQQLRDLLFANCLPSPLKIPVFRYIAVLPEQGEGGYDATVYYAYSLEDWHLGGCAWDDAQAYVASLIENTPFCGKRLFLRMHVHEEGSYWPIPWDMTLRDEAGDTQILVLVSHEDGDVSGALLRDLHSGDACLKAIASTYAEPAETQQLLDEFEKLQPHDFWFFGIYFERKVRAEVRSADVDALGEIMADSPSGSKYLLLYDTDHEWKWGQVLAQGGSLQLESLSDHYAIRTSEEKRSRRPGVGLVMANASLRGDYTLLQDAIRLLNHRVEYRGPDCEQDEAIRLLCDWWNATAPENYRDAGLFHLYCWDEQERIFLSGEHGEPARLASHLVASGPYAVFEKEGEPLVVVSFCKGRRHNQLVDGAVHSYSVNGETFHVYQDRALDSVDEVYLSWAGLKALRSRRWDIELNYILTHPEIAEAGPEDMLTLPGYTFTMQEDMMVLIGDDIHLSWHVGATAPGDGSKFSVQVEPRYLSIKGQGMRVALPIYGADAYKAKTYLRDRGFHVIRSGERELVRDGG